MIYGNRVDNGVDFMIGNERALPADELACARQQEKHIAVAEELLGAAVVCIADLTGDKTLAKALVRRQPRVCQEPCQYREPPANKYNTTVDNGSTMLECPECKCRIQYNAFTYAVGTLGFSFCPYCGADVREEMNNGSDDDI